MLYSIVAYDVPNSLPLREKARPDHVARLKALSMANRLVVAGPNPAIDNTNPGDDGFTGSIIIARFASLDAAKEWASDDPYIHAGVYAKVEVKPFKQVLPAPVRAIEQQDS